MSGSKDHHQIRSLGVSELQGYGKGTSEATRTWMVGRFSHRGLLPTPIPSCIRFLSLHCKWVVRCCAAETARSKWTQAAQPKEEKKKKPEWRTGQSNSAKQSLPIYQDELGAMNHFVSFVRFVVRNRGNKRTIRRPFTHWPFTFINTAVVSVTSISPVQSLGELTLY